MQSVCFLAMHAACESMSCGLCDQRQVAAIAILLKVKHRQHHGKLCQQPALTGSPWDCRMTRLRLLLARSQTMCASTTWPSCELWLCASQPLPVPESSRCPSPEKPCLCHICTPVHSRSRGISLLHRLMHSLCLCGQPLLAQPCRLQCRQVSCMGMLQSAVRCVRE